MQQDANLKFSVGEQLLDTYAIKQVIGEGAFGRVFLAHHKSWDLDVVLKVPKEEILADPQLRHRIRREAEAWTDLGLHPHIAYCFYVHPIEGVPLLIIEYIDGGNLRSWISQAWCLDLQTGLDLAIQFCHGLEHAHSRGMIHRDIKPENILMAKDGTLKITDFGIVRINPSEVSESEGYVSRSSAQETARTVGAIGTYEYMAPEQFHSTELDERVDIFAFGVCLYEMFCARRPYSAADGPEQEAPDPRAVRPSGVLPERLCHLMRRCVDWDRACRPASVQRIREELSPIYYEEFGRPSSWAELPKVSIEADGWNNRGVSYLVLGQEEEALRCFGKALAANPHHLETTYNQALLLWRRSKIDDIEVLRRLERLTSVIGGEERELALACAAVHRERFDPESAQRELSRYPGLYRERFTEGEPSWVGSLRTLEAPGGAVVSVALSSKGHLGVSVSECESEEPTLEVWDFKKGRHLRHFTGHAGSISSVAIASHGRVALTGSRGDRTLKVWDLDSGHCMRVLEGHADGVTSVALTADGQRGLSGSWQILKLWDLETGQCLRTLEGHRTAVASVALTPNGHRALSGDWNGNLRVWELAAAQSLSIPDAHLEPISSVAITGNGRRGLSSAGNVFKLWDLESGQCLRVFEGHVEPVSSLATTADGRLALSGSWDNTVKLWDSNNGRCLRTLEGHSWSVDSVAVTPDGRLGLSGGLDGMLKLWRLDISRPMLHSFKPCRPKKFVQLRAEQDSRAAAVQQIETFCANGDYLSAYRRLMEIWGSVGFSHELGLERLYSVIRTRGIPDTLLAAVCRLLVEDFVGEQPVVALSVDGRRALSGGSDDKTLKLWDLETGQCLRSFEAHSGTAVSVALTSDGRQGLSASGDGIKLWDLETARCLLSLKGHSGWVYSLAITPDGRWALSGGSDATLRLWDLQAGQSVRTLEGHSAFVDSVAITPDGHVGLSGSGDENTIKVWDLTTGQCLHTLKGRSPVCSVALTPDGRCGLSGRENGILELWDLRTGECLCAFQAHSNAIESVAIIHDGHLGLSGAEDKALKVWNLRTAECLRSLRTAAGISSLAMTPDASFVLAGHKNGTMSYWYLIWSLEFRAHQPSSS